MSQDATSQRPTIPQAPQMKITLYDQVSSLLVALLAIVGSIVFVLFIAFLSQNIKFDMRTAVEVISEEGGGNDRAQGVADELEDPGVEEMPDVMEPQIAATLDNVSSVVSAVSTVDALEGNSTVMGKGTGLGDSRAAGPGGPGTAGVTPRWERWTVRFSSTSVDMYARQLDFFGIELGAIGGGSKDVEYAAGLSKRPIQRRTGPSKDEKRLFMSWTGKGALKQFDLQLLQMAGVPMQGKEVLQFYSPETEARMAQLESAKLAGKPLKSVKRTIFAVRSSGTGFEMYVAEQQYQ